MPVGLQPAVQHRHQLHHVRGWRQRRTVLRCACILTTAIVAYETLFCLCAASFDRHCHYYQPWMLSALCGAVTVLYGSLVRFTATCDCLHGRDFFQNNCCGARCKGAVTYLGGVVLTLFSCELAVECVLWCVAMQCVAVHSALFGSDPFMHDCERHLFTALCIRSCYTRHFILFTVLSVFLIVWTVVQCYLTNIGYTIFTTLLLSKLWSFAEWFLWAAPYFSYRYPPDKRHFYSRLNHQTSSSRESGKSGRSADSAESKV